MTSDQPEAPKRFKAFISYGHGRNPQLAQRLQSALEKFAKPWYKVRACKIFRDSSNLAIAPDLWAEIERALAQSEHLLFLASPEAIGSKWVDRELKYWLANSPAANLHIVKVAGEIVWDEQEGDFDWTKTTCIPAALKGAFHHLPLYVDCSGFTVDSAAPDVKAPSFKAKEFLDAVATIAARLHGKEKDQIFGEHIRQHRRAIGLAWSALIVLLGLAIGLTVTLVHEKAARESSRQQARIATAQRLAAQARTLIAAESRPQAALLLAVASLRIAETHGEARAPAAEEAMRVALAHVGGTGLGPIPEIEHAFLASSPDGRLLAVKKDARSVALWRLGGEEPAKTFEIRADQELGKLSFTADSAGLISVDHQRVRIWSVEQGRPSGKPMEVEVAAPISVFAMSPDGRWLVVGQKNGMLSLVSLNRTAVAGKPITAGAHDGPILAAEISANGRFLVTGSSDKTAKLWDLTQADPLRSPLRVFPGHSSGVSLLAISPDGGRIVTAGNHNIPRLWRSWQGTAGPPLLLEKIEETIAWLELSPDGRWLVSGGPWAYAALSDLNAADPSKSYTVLPSYGGPVGLAVFSPDSRQILTAAGMAADELAEATTPESVARLWDLTTVPPRAPLELRGHTDLILDAKFLHHGDYWATASFDGTIRLWDPKGRSPGQPAAVLRGHDGPVFRLAADQDGRWLASASVDGTARLWPLADESAGASAPIRMSLRKPATLSASSDGRWLFAGDRFFVLWNLQKSRPSIGGQILQLPDGVGAPANSVLSHDGNWLATGFGGEERKVLLLWDLRRGLGESKPVLVDTKGRDIGALALTDNRLAVSLPQSAQGSELDLWDLSRQPLQQLNLPYEPVTAFALDRDGSMLATADAGGLHLLGIGRETSALASAPIPSGGVLHRLEFSPGNGWLLGRNFPKDTMVTLWRIQNGKAISPARILSAQPTPLQVVSVSPDERWLATGSFGDPLHVWHLALEDLDHPWLALPMKASISLTALFSPDGRWLATTSFEGVTQLWDLALGKDAVDRPIVLRGHSRPLVRLAFSRDSRWLISADTDLDPENDPSKTCRIWDLRSPDPANSFIVLPTEQLPQGADKLDVSVDGRWLITSSLDGVRLWPLGSQHLIEMAERAAGRPLTQEEKRIYNLPGSAITSVEPERRKERSAPRL